MFFRDICWSIVIIQHRQSPPHPSDPPARLQLFKVDPGSVVSLFAELRKKWSFLQAHSEQNSSILLFDMEEGAMEPEACCMWAMLEVLNMALQTNAEAINAFFGVL